MNHKEPNKGFLGIDFSNFFGNCGCVGRGNAQEESLSSLSSARNQPNPETKRRNHDDLSIASEPDWNNLDDDHLHNDHAHLIQGRINHQGPGFDEYETMEPIDFDYLKPIGSTEEDEDRKSLASGISKNSKKISKLQHADDASSHKKSVKDSPTGKGAKARSKRNPWQPHEDKLLLDLVAKHGQVWSQLATMIEGRTGKQIRDRYLNILKPNTKKGDWTPQEDHLILSLYYQYGRKWSKISGHVPGRTEGQVKNRFYAHIQKKMIAYDGVPEAGADYNNQLNLQLQPHQLEIQQAPQQASLFGTQSSYPPSNNLTPTGAQGYSNGFPAFPTNAYPQNQYQSYQPAHLNDPTDLISYQDNAKVQRSGSNEVFVDNSSSALPSPSQKSFGSNWANTPSPGSIKNNERDLDDVLDRVAMFLERGVSSVEVQGENSRNQSVNHFFADGSATDKMEKVGLLQKRKQALEMLLMRTENQLAGFNPQEQNAYYMN